MQPRVFDSAGHTVDGLGTCKGDPADPRTARLIERGVLAPVAPVAAPVSKPAASKPRGKTHDPEEDEA
ncbi:hypothetical protein [Brevibacterium moorei]|uniref:hypothetical protein n=1 Tax=Brevibacterium moorei TaxID=2968457 RepID=UPI00211C4641|nr:hypothetical protein [Brevibacterium sp. 68QC2CO]MCQ9384448.1 hypothetical protein [Brevibacterium sp. 68QC2CO]